jgi:hypothetical protein
MFRNLGRLPPFIIPPIDISNPEPGEFSRVDIIETGDIDSYKLSRLRKVDFMKRVHAALFAKIVVNRRGMANVVRQYIVIAGRLRQQSKFVWLDSSSPISKFCTDGAIALECFL